jgi:peroxiredoxin
MSQTPSTMLVLGTHAPDFQLPDVATGRTISLSTFKGRKGLLVIFLCRHCPYVIHVQKELTRIGRDYGPRGIGIVAISSNDVGAYPEDSPENLKQMAVEEGFEFPVCYDESQAVAKAYRAACTPEFYLFDGDRKLVYRGQLDGSRPQNNIPVTGKDLRKAMDSQLSGGKVDPNQKPGIGCNIKWKPGNEPDYYPR